MYVASSGRCPSPDGLSMSMSNDVSNDMIHVDRHDVTRNIKKSSHKTLLPDSESSWLLSKPSMLHRSSDHSHSPRAAAESHRKTASC